MAERADLLLEIGTEELPPDSLVPLAEALGAGLTAELERAGLGRGETRVYATPRRIAALVTEVGTEQPSRPIERRGPAVSAAFDAEGRPTRAALGFAASCGVELEQLERLETEKGSWLVFRTTELGQATVALLPTLVGRVVAGLPVARRMRWGTLEDEFVRPVHWVVLLLGDDPVETELFGVTSGRETRGHRFHHPGPLEVTEPAGYAQLLYAGGHVVADFDTRRETIRRQVEEAGRKLGGEAVIDERLLAEVTALCEWPVPVSGRFDAEFLALPAPVLIAVMQGAQRYFHVRDAAGALLPHFIAVSNIESRNPDAVRAGNERVIRPRFKDAAFFYDADRRQPLESRLEATARVKFHERLGSLHDKAQRVSQLCAHVAIALGLDPEAVRLARRAGLLSKCDLATEMVGEFPELQGVMGGEYARLDGEPESVATALAESYLPRFAGDRLPETPIGRALAVADRLDTLTGLFAAGEPPTGDKDPYGLRRAALGVLRILIEGELNLDLNKLLAAAAEQHGDRVPAEGVAERVFEFVTERLRAYFADQGVTPDVFAAVMARRPPRPYDFARRVSAVEAFRKLPEAASLAAANKRIQNILRQSGEPVPDEVDDTLFREDAEWNLAAKLVGLGPRVRELLAGGDYPRAMLVLAGFSEPIDAFFETVKVMADDDDVRRNRLALLGQLRRLFLATADVSELQV